MLKKTISYTDYNGVDHTEDFYFNLTKVECAEIEYGLIPGSNLSDSINVLINSNDMATVISTIKKIVLMAYGEKSADGKRFVKNDEIREAFEQSPVFEIVYWELITEPTKAADFIAGILPSSIRDALGPEPEKALLTKIDNYKPAN